MNINAKQMTSIDVHNKMDITTALGFFFQIREKIRTNEALRTALSTVWTAFSMAYAGFDQAYAQQRKWAQTEDLKNLDDQRDDALRAYLNMLKAMLASPNAEKAAKAKLLQNIRDKYALNPGDEYMKETTAIAQFVQEMDTNYQAELARQATGLEEFYQALKSANTAFLAKMNERTEEQSYQQKGIVRETRLATEAAYRDLVKLINAMAIMEMPEGFYWDDVINSLNAEIDHYKNILARKGSSSSGGEDEGGDEPEPSPEPEPTPATPETPTEPTE